MTPATRPPDSEPSWLLALRLIRWPLVLLLAVVIASLATLRVCRTVAEGGRDAAAGIARGLSSATLTTSFVSDLPRLVPGSGTSLELAAVEVVETVTRREDRRTLFDLLPLGTTVAEIRVPVTYRYHVRLDGPWRLTISDRTCRVEAPPLEPTLPPAIHTDRMEKRAEHSWLPLDPTPELEVLERSLTPTLAARAGRAESLALVREHSRAQLEAFVRGWLLGEGAWRPDALTSVEVRFADEAERDLAAPTLRPPRVEESR